MDAYQTPGYQAHTSLGKKVLVATLLVTMVGAVLPLIYHRGFVPAAHWQKTALYITLALLLASAVWLRQLKHSGAWSPQGPWLDYGPFKRMLMLPLMVAFMGMIFWLNVAVTLPMGWNGYKGEEAFEFAVVQPQLGSGRHSCRHQLKIESIDFPFFEFCIDEEDFLSLPQERLPAQLLLQQSFFGKNVQSLSLNASWEDVEAQAYEAGASEAVEAAAEAVVDSAYATDYATQATAEDAAAAATDAAVDAVDAAADAAVDAAAAQ